MVAIVSQRPRWEYWIHSDHCILPINIRSSDADSLLTLSGKSRERGEEQSAEEERYSWEDSLPETCAEQSIRYWNFRDSASSTTCHQRLHPLSPDCNNLLGCPSGFFSSKVGQAVCSPVHVMGWPVPILGYLRSKPKAGQLVYQSCGDYAESSHTCLDLSSNGRTQL